MDPGGKRDSQDALRRLGKERDRLERMAHDVLGLGVRLGFLVQQFDPWHLPALFAHLDAVAHQHQPTVDPNQPGEHAEDDLGPSRRQGVQLDACAVKAIEQVVVVLAVEAEGADDARHPQVVRTDREPEYTDREPHESPAPGKKPV